MKKAIWTVIAIAVVGYFVHSYMENKAKRKAERAEVERIEQATKSVISQMVSRTNARSDWETILSKGEKVRIEPILTVELERVWLQETPILFIGSIGDIATCNQSQYVVIVEKNLLGSLEHIFTTELQLSLLSGKNKIDSFLKEHPDLFKNYGFKNGVAVVARIKSIRTTHVQGEGGERQEVKIGDGELIDIAYMGDVFL